MAFQSIVCGKFSLQRPAAEYSEADPVGGVWSLSYRLEKLQEIVVEGDRPLEKRNAPPLPLFN